MGRAIVAGGKPAMAAPVTGILASDLAVGSTVKLIENSSPVEYLVVHNGLPSSLYDASCDGLWLLRKDLYIKRVWGGTNRYKNSGIHKYLNETFIGLFDEGVREVIRTAKIPYVNGYGNTGTVMTGSDGLDAQIFLLAVCEAGFTTGSYYPVDGTNLSYFSGASNSKRIANLNGTATVWTLRSPYTSGNASVWAVRADGSFGDYGAATAYGIRPALILPSNAIFDEETMILKGVA